MNEAKLSYTIKAIDPQGWDEMFTVRGDEPADYFSKISALKKWLVANGYTPNAPRRSPQANATSAAAGPVCEWHGEMKLSKFGGYYCPAKMASGEYCKNKAAGTQPAAAPMSQAQAIQYAAAPQPPVTNGSPPAPPMAGTHEAWQDMSESYDDDNYENGTN